MSELDHARNNSKKHGNFIVYLIDKLLQKKHVWPQVVTKCTEILELDQTRGNHIADDADKASNF